MSNEKMREEFEEWAAVRFAVDQKLLAESRTEEDMDNGFPYRIVNQHGEESDLVNTLVGAAWAGWQASRASLVVDLGDMEWIHYDEVRDTLEQSGLKVKP